MELIDLQTKSIGLFDSGFGGLTVMRAITELIPHENIIYFGDTARLPYGSKSVETIVRYSLENTAFLVSLGIKVLVIACNTSSATALDEVRKATNIPVIGITELGQEEISAHFSHGKVALLGTRATIASGIYQKQITAELFPIACPLFVPLVEEGYIEHTIATAIAKDYLSPLKNHQITRALLGCTHYPLLKSIIQQEIGPDVQLIDPAFFCAKNTKTFLAKKNLLNPSLASPHHQFFVSDDPEKFRRLGKTFLGCQIESVQHV